MSGFWSKYGALGTVDWCEPNYIVSTYVAEWYNTTTSLLIVALGMYGIFHMRRQVTHIPARFTVSLIGMSIVGFGSTLFHGTLLSISQASDELPMIYLALIFAYIVRFRGVQINFLENKSKVWAWRIGLFVYASLFTFVYFYSKQFFLFFITSYALLVGILVIYAWRIVYRKYKHKYLRPLYWLSVLSYVGGVFFLWFPEHVFLPCDHFLQNFELHGFFHITSGIGTYSWIIFCFRDHILTMHDRGPNGL